MEYKETEVRFLEVDKEALIEKLRRHGAIDHGEQLLDEIILYDMALTWRDDHVNKRLLRLRTQDGKTKLTFKHAKSLTLGDNEEIEFEVSDGKAAEVLLERLGYPAYRHQQKYRHTFTLDGVTIDIDTWPKVPTYVELEGKDETSLKEMAEKLGLDWGKVELRLPRMIIEETYGIPMGNMRWFTFERFE
jgi:adenylate cyclase class 2